MILSEMPASPMFSLARDATVYTTPRQSTSLLVLARSLRLTISDYFSKASSATIFDLATPQYALAQGPTRGVFQPESVLSSQRSVFEHDRALAVGFWGTMGKQATGEAAGWLDSFLRSCIKDYLIILRFFGLIRTGPRIDPTGCDGAGRDFLPGLLNRGSCTNNEDQSSGGSVRFLALITRFSWSGAERERARAVITAAAMGAFLWSSRDPDWIFRILDLIFQLVLQW